MKYRKPSTTVGKLQKESWQTMRLYKYIVGLIVITFAIALWMTKCEAHPIDMEALATVESSNNPKACSYKGCKYGRGLYQISEIVLKHYNQTQTKDYSWLPKRLQKDYSSGRVIFLAENLFDPMVNRAIANWYLNWLYDICWTVEDTLIAFNWGIGNWRNWRKKSDDEQTFWVNGVVHNYNDIPALPKETQEFLKKYKEALKEG